MLRYTKVKSQLMAIADLLIVCICHHSLPGQAAGIYLVNTKFLM